MRTDVNLLKHNALSRLFIVHFTKEHIAMNVKLIQNK